MTNQQSDQPHKPGFAQLTMQTFVEQLAAKRATPGGGAAAGLSAAIASALGAMAAAYTTGAKWIDTAPDADRLLKQLHTATQELTRLADADADAFAALQAAERSSPPDTAAIAAASQRCCAIPLSMMEHGTAGVTALADFHSQCNPYLVADLLASLHLLRGAIGAAYEMVLINQPTDAQQQRAQDYLSTVDQAFTQALHHARG